MELTTVWFCLIAILWVGYLTLEGFDFGVGMLLPVLGKTEKERRVMYNTIGPVWDGNEVWVLVAGGATFAAFPEWYATLFSGFYLPLLLILVALIVRNLAFEYRGKRDDDTWRRRWDLAAIVGSFLPALLWGVAFANIVAGVPIDQNKEFTGNLFTLLNPFGLLGGLVTLTLFLTHGAMFVALKTDGEIRHRARALSVKLGLVAAVLAVVFILWTLIKADWEVAAIVLFALAAVCLLAAIAMAAKGREGWAFVGTFATIAFAVLGLFWVLFPAVMPSSTDPAYSLMASHDPAVGVSAAATTYTLTVMTWVAVIFTPLVLAYQGWSYWVFRQRITVDQIPDRAGGRRPHLMRPLDPELIGHLRPARRALAGVLAGGLFGGLLTVGQGIAVASLIVWLIEDPGAGRWRTAAGWLIAVVLLRVVAGYVTDVSAARAAGQVSISLRHRVLRGVVGAGSADRSRQVTGEVTLLAGRGMAAVEPYVTRYLPSLLLAAVLPAATIAAIAWADWLSALVVLGTVPLVPVFAILIGLATQERADRQWRLLGVLSGHFLDVVRGLPTLVAHRRAAAQTGSIRAITERYRKATVETLKVAFLSSAALELIATISVALVAVEVGLRLAAGRLDFWTAMVVLLLAPEAYWPLRRVGAEFHAAAEGVASFTAAGKYLGADLDEPPTAESVPGADGGRAAGAIHVRELTVGYPGRPEPVLAGLSLDISVPGLTAIVGPSGCGKTTLLAALLGELAIAGGVIEVGERPLPPDWLHHVAWAPQQPWLTAESIRSTVAMGRPAATTDEIWAALRELELADAVAALPQGLDTRLGEDGAGLSAGQRARLALARVIVSDRPYVLLDEPSAHLDRATEEVMLTALRRLAATRCVVVVAHRSAVVDAAGLVVRLTGPQAQPTTETPVTLPVEAERPAAVVPADAPSPAGPPSSPDRPIRHGLALGTVLGALSSAAGVALTATASWLITRAAEHPPVLTLMVAIVGVRTFGLARPVLRYGERVVSHDAALHALAEHRAGVYERLVPLIPAALGPRRGDVLTTIVDDVDSLLDRQLRVRQPVAAAIGVMTAATAGALVVSLAAGAVVAAVGLGGVVGWWLARWGAAAGEADVVRLRAEVATGVEELVHGGRQLVLWAALDRALARLDQVGASQSQATVRAARGLALGRAAPLLAGCLGVVGMAAVSPAAVSGPTLALLVMLPIALIDLLAPLADAGALSVRTAAAQARLQELAATAPAVSDPADPVRPADAEFAAPAVTVAGVTAGWDDRDALAGLTISVPPGGRLGVVGPSGVGKSTLAALLVRFIDPRAGAVRLAGHDLRSLRLADTRGAVLLIDDTPYVFASSIVENVRLARPDATDAEVSAALTAAALGPWVASLPAGIHTLVGEGHAEVSGGERARLALARALLADPPVLVLDEPTAHLDSDTARHVTAVLLDHLGERSVVWITHRDIGLDRMDSTLRLEVDSGGAGGAGGD